MTCCVKVHIRGGPAQGLRERFDPVTSEAFVTPVHVLSGRDGTGWGHVRTFVQVSP